MKKYISLLLVSLTFAGVGCNSDEGLSPLNYETLEVLITDCRTEYAAAVEGADLGQYVFGSKAIFAGAIRDAEYVRGNTDRQSALDNYVFKLDMARTVFRESKVAMACPYFGGTAYIDCGAAGALIGTVYTIELWVKMSSATGTGAGLVGAEGSDGSVWDGLMIRRAEGVEKALDFCIVNGMWSSCLTPANSFAFERWTHVACSFDGRNAKIYLDGVLSGTTTIGEYATKCWGSLILGDMAFFRGRYLIGSLYDFRIWNTVRSEQQIQEQMHTLLEGSEEGLVANWKFNVKGGTTVTDLTGKHTATLYNITWTDLDREVK